MELTFEKVGNQYVAEFQAPSDFNLHIEREEIGVLEVHQRGSEEGKYDFAWGTGVNGRKVVDYDFGALVYPKWIKVVSGNEVVKAFVTCSNGEATQIVASKYEFVDLGLPSGTMWATTNLGATKPEEIGLYFAWGEIEGVKTPTEFDLLLNNYKWYDAKTEQYSKYNSTDGLSTLELEDDCAYQTNDKMRMPTVDECQELLDNVSRVFVTNYNESGINGAVLTSTINGNSIFIPASMSNGEDSVIWSKSLNNDSTAYCLNIDLYAGLTHDTIRYIEIPVRPVQDK